MNTLRSTSSLHRAAWRVLVALAVLCLAAWTLRGQAPAPGQLPQLLRHASGPLLLAATAFQVPRYFGAGLLMRAYARLYGRSLSPWQASAVALASGAAARILPFGGAGGIIVRALYLKAAGLSNAAVATYFVLQNYLGTAVLILLFALALVYQQLTLPSRATSLDGLARPLLGLVAMVSLTVLLRQYPEQASSVARQLGTACDRLLGRVRRHGRPLAQALPESVLNLGHGLAMGGLGGFLAALFYSSWTILGDIASFVASIAALGASVSAAQAIAAYALSSFLGSASGLPAGLGVTEGALVALLVGFGENSTVAVGGVLVFRAISFWLPIPFGAIAGTCLRSALHAQPPSSLLQR